MSAYAVSARGLAGRKVPQGVLTPMGDLLFAASEPGAWYDPSDMSTLFQDSAGTTPVTAVEQPVGRMLDKSGRGNHAIQATTTKRPVLSARVNWLTKTNELTAAPWLPYASSIAPAAEPAPIGGSQAFKLAESNTNALHRLEYTSAATAGAGYKLEFLVKPAGRNQCSVFEDSGSGTATFNLVAGTYSSVAVGTTASINPVGDGWWRVSIAYTQIGAFSRARIATSATSYLGDGVSGVLVCAPSLTLATDAQLPYQWVKTATDYDADPSKFPAYRRLDGVDDSHASATGGGGTAGFFFSAAVTPQGGAGTARTLFSDAGTNTGYIVRLNTSNQLELSAGNGTTYTTIATAGTLAVGSTDIVQAWDDGTNLNVKIGSGATASIARPTVSAGTAGYTMGQDNGASTGYFNGRAYSTIYRKDSGLTQVQREAVALYQRQKARMP